MSDIRETCYEQSDGGKGCLSTNEGVWIRKIQRLAAEHPDEVVIRYEPETNYGYLVAEVPSNWFVIRPPKKVNLSEEQKDALRERMAVARSKRFDAEE